MNGVLNGSLCHVLIFAFWTRRVHGNTSTLLWFCMINKIAELEWVTVLFDLFHMARSAFSRHFLLMWSGLWRLHWYEGWQFAHYMLLFITVRHPWTVLSLQRNIVSCDPSIEHNMCNLQYITLFIDFRVMVLLKEWGGSLWFYSAVYCIMASVTVYMSIS